MKTTLLDFYGDLSIYLTSLDWPRAIFPLKIFSLFFSLLLLAVAIILIFQIREQLRKSLEMISQSVNEPSFPKKAMVKKWETVLAKLAKDDENSYKLAVIEADKIFDDLLKRIGYQGQDMGERLKQLTPAQAANLNEIWQAHKLRNQIVHQPDFHLTHSQAERAIEVYQGALENLEAI